MKNVSKSAILPIVSVVLLGLGTITNHKFTADTVNYVATIAAVVLTFGINVWGIIKNHKK